MAALAWIALFSPAVAVVVIALLGERITRYTAGLLAAGSTLVSFVCTVAIFVDLLGRDPEERSELTTPVDVADGRGPPRRRLAPDRSRSRSS